MQQQIIDYGLFVTIWCRKVIFWKLVCLFLGVTIRLALSLVHTTTYVRHPQGMDSRRTFNLPLHIACHAPRGHNQDRVSLMYIALQGYRVLFSSPLIISHNGSAIYCIENVASSRPLVYVPCSRFLRNSLLYIAHAPTSTSYTYSVSCKLCTTTMETCKQRFLWLHIPSGLNRPDFKISDKLGRGT